MTTFMAFYGVEMHCRKTITGIKRATIRRRDDKELSHRITRCCWFMAPHFGLIPVVVPAAVFPMRLMTLATLVSRFFCNVATDLYTAAPIQRTHFCIFLMQSERVFNRFQDRESGLLLAWDAPRPQPLSCRDCGTPNHGSFTRCSDCGSTKL